jgi:hypothetical protein
VTSTAKLYVTALLVFPYASTAETAKLCVPSDRLTTVRGLVQALGVAPSREQEKVTPASPSVKANVAVVELDAAGGVDVKLGCGGAVASTVTVAFAH